MIERLPHLLAIAALFLIVTGCNQTAVRSDLAVAPTISPRAQGPASHVDPECEEWGIEDHYGGPGTCDQGK